MLSRCLYVGVGWPAARDDRKFQVACAFENFLRERGMVRDVDVHSLKSLDDLVLRAARFGDLADYTKRHVRPRRLIFAKLNGGFHFSADRVGKDGRQDEVVACDKNTCAHNVYLGG